MQFWHPTGSCAPDGTIRFNWRVVMAEPALIEYVVLHELLHLKVRNHGCGSSAQPLSCDASRQRDSLPGLPGYRVKGGSSNLRYRRLTVGGGFAARWGPLYPTQCAWSPVTPAGR